MLKNSYFSRGLLLVVTSNWQEILVCFKMMAGRNIFITSGMNMVWCLVMSGNYLQTNLVNQSLIWWLLTYKRQSVTLWSNNISNIPVRCACMSRITESWMDLRIVTWLNIPVTQPLIMWTSKMVMNGYW